MPVAPATLAAVLARSAAVGDLDRLESDLAHTRAALEQSQHLAENLVTEQERTKKALADTQLLAARMAVERGQALPRPELLFEV